MENGLQAAADGDFSQARAAAGVRTMPPHTENGGATVVETEQCPPCMPQASKGSIGHPTSCGPACKFIITVRGCKDGNQCSHCHLCKWRKVPKRASATQGKSLDTAVPAGAVEKRSFPRAPGPAPPACNSPLNAEDFASPELWPQRQQFSSGIPRPDFPIPMDQPMSVPVHASTMASMAPDTNSQPFFGSLPSAQPGGLQLLPMRIPSDAGTYLHDFEPQPWADPGVDFEVRTKETSSPRSGKSAGGPGSADHLVVQNTFLHFDDPGSSAIGEGVRAVRDAQGSRRCSSEPGGFAPKPGSRDPLDSLDLGTSPVRITPVSIVGDNSSS